MLSFNNLTIGYNKQPILRAISGQIQTGQLVALIGENGAGKSTLIHALAGKQKYHGQIQFNHLLLADYTSAELASQRAVMMQSEQLAFAFTCEELIAMGRYPYIETNATTADKVAQYMTLMDLNHLSGRRADTLSGGELQRVYMARCFAQLDAFSAPSQTKLMLLDEPTSALDMRHQHALLSTLKRFVEQGNSAIVAIHDLNLASLYASHGILLHKQEILAQGSISEVITEHHLKKIYAMPLYVKAHPLQNVPIIYSERQEFL
ncbi:heme ABC transporter ATP-binding protein [Pseudoalteromonas mariniglutinosa]|uniref:heme ABC transporter ATP-binding protein n=1 Tax=Pseudoalteromonas mariniglutinosa TaxID=206042 RepID=UPI00384BDFD6